MLLDVFPDMSTLVITVTIKIVCREGIDLIMKKMVIIRSVETMKFDGLDPLDCLARTYCGNSRGAIYNTEEDIVVDCDQAQSSLYGPSTGGHGGQGSVAMHVLALPRRKLDDAFRRCSFVD
jgi:hypothetical protein